MATIKSYSDAPEFIPEEEPASEIIPSTETEPVEVAPAETLSAELAPESKSGEPEAEPTVEIPHLDIPVDIPAVAADSRSFADLGVAPHLLRAIEGTRLSPSDAYSGNGDTPSVVERG